METIPQNNQYNKNPLWPCIKKVKKEKKNITCLILLVWCQKISTVASEPRARFMLALDKYGNFVYMGPEPATATAVRRHVMFSSV